MSKKARLSRDQKRKQKLDKRNRRMPDAPALAYAGNRYRSKEFVKPLFETEQGIYDMYIISGRELTDSDVEEQIVELIDELRSRPAADLIYEAAPEEDEAVDASVRSMILGHWSRLLEQGTLPRRDDLIGILRTILGSVDVWRSKSASSRGYLSHLEGFLHQLGYRVVAVNQHGEVRGEPTPDELYEVGQMWLAGSPEARHRFTALASELIKCGQSPRVVNVAQRLLGEINSTSRPEFPILSELAIRAQKEERPVARTAPAPGLKRFISRLTDW